MSRPTATNGDSVTNTSWQIADARAFTVGKSLIVHAPHSFPRSAVVVGKCGVVGNTDSSNEENSRLAVWAAEFPTCPTCTTR